MIKILFFLERLYGGGAEKVLCDLVNHMDHSRFDITVQTVWPYKGKRILDPAVKYKSVFSVRNKTTEKLYRIEAASGMMYKLHVKDNYDIECAFLEAGPTKIIAASTNKKAKKIAWVHSDLSRAVQNHALFVKKTQPWYERFDKIACVSEDVKASFDRLYGEMFSSTVVHNVIDSDTIIEKSWEQLPADIIKKRITALSIGRLEYPKGYDILLRVCKRLLDDGLCFDLWIAGEGAQQPELEQYVRENNLGENIRLLGFRKNPYPIMVAADFLVCSSRWEGYSTFATEGIILGKSMLTTNCTGMHELFGESEYGYVVENNENALYLGMKQMITEKSLRAKFESAAQSRAKQMSLDALVQETVAYITAGVNCEK